jgi:hypothetical protein
MSHQAQALVVELRADLAGIVGGPVIDDNHLTEVLERQHDSQILP